MLWVEFFERDFSERIRTPWKEIDVRRFSFKAQGGPKNATFRVRGDLLDLWEFAEMMRVPIVIHDSEKVKPVWWGFINSVTIHTGSTRRKVTMDGMANRIAVAYTNGRERETTTFAANTESSSEFGKKELLLSATDITDSQAQNFRDTMLDQRKYPSISIPVADQAGVYAEVECLGWWETLAWQYYSNEAGKVEYTELDSFPGRTVQKQGDGRPRCAQSFINNSGSNWDADTIYIRARKVDGGIGVSDDLEVYLYDDSGNEPNASQANGSITAANIATQEGWEEFTLSSSVTLVDGDTYWIVVQNQTYPAVDGDDYFFIGGNSAEGYVNGQLLLYNVNSAAWESWTQPMDMNFRVIGTEETTTQISNIISDAGEFLVDTDIINASGLSTIPHRSGDYTAQYEILELLNKGTTNDKRLLARVLSNYHLEVYEEPDLYEEDYSISQNGKIKDNNGARVQPTECPVGIWIQYEDSVPSSVNTQRLANAGYIFVEEAEYNNGKYKIIRSRDVETIGLFGIQDG